MPKILTIGNSFARNATQYLEAMVASDGRNDLIIGRANLGGCSLEKHGNLVEQCDLLPGIQPYAFQVNGAEPRPATLREALAADDWDGVTLQQASRLAFRPETYMPHIATLRDLVREHAPRAEPLVHRIWGYQCDDPLLEEFGLDDEGMSAGIEVACAKAAEHLGCRVIPCGRAFDLARAALCYAPDPAFDFEDPQPLDLPDQRASLHVGYTWHTGNTLSGRAELHLDGRHLNAKGAYLANAVWYEFFTGRCAAANPFRPEGVLQNEKDILANAAHAAVAEARDTPFWDGA